MKKILLTSAMFSLATLLSSAATLTFNTTTNGFYLISTNRASVYSIEISTPAANATPTTVSFYDCDSVANPYFGTNYVADAFPYRLSYATNMALSYVGSNGYTNWTTNIGVYTITKTNAASTNALPVQAAVNVAAGLYAIYNVDALFSRGICVVANTNSSVIVNYRTGQ